jgi:predicted RecB family endonuclease
MAQEPPVQVAERIHDHALAIAERDGANYTDTLNDVCFGSPDGLYNAKKKTFTRIANADEFLRGDTERQRTQRLKMLYEIGLRIAIDGDPAAEPDEPPDLFEGREKGAGK